MSASDEREGIEHAIHGYAPVKQVGGKIVEPKGVTIMDRNGVVNQGEQMEKMSKGVEIIDPRNGRKP